MAEAKKTRDHDVIRQWVDARCGKPATVKQTQQGNEPAGLLRIDFGEPDKQLEAIPWDEFFQKFDAENLAFLYQEKTEDGDTSRFCKFVDANA
ncbi:hypothetical protein Mal4_11110 [Maioricimonas rarisocia]|uniref:Uncharacterized protein n=1 Tax=Maioricimonas rarisocia TaxID=2528026 RepID=A0A517Z2X7_9PLAN|nr:hypothetical protein [Maioricimonas rarisocia]QDU36813.1 hypothetical protein Mal4_11110 [Maioricimonas rarisocia]